jgi:23S rRNA (adenine-N6)-dimethyltransferase
MRGSRLVSARLSSCVAPCDRRQHNALAGRDEVSNQHSRRGDGARPEASSSQVRRDQARKAAAVLPFGAGRRRRTLSQNFLSDARAVRSYLDAVGRPELPAIELGAGDGSLTVALADVVPHLTAVELDPVLAARLRRRVHHLDNVEVLEKDILTMPHPENAYVLVGNIPFAITSAIVDWALASPHLEAATLITQRKYARKRTGDYGRWTLATVRSWPWWDWTLGPRIRRDSFRPRPAVDAAVLQLKRRSRPLVPRSEERAWVRAVETGFKGVGGSLRASLGTIYTQRRVDAAVMRVGVSRDEVVAFVTPDQWTAIFGELSSWR